MIPWWRPRIDPDDLTVNLNGLRTLLGLHECHRQRDHRELVELLTDTNTKLDTLLGIATQQRQEERQMALDLTALSDQLKAETNAVTAVELVLSAQGQKIQELINASGKTVDPVALQAIVDGFKTQNARLARLAADALANTPAAPAPAAGA